jgi:hypothetical protein
MYVCLIASIHDNYCCLTLCDYSTNDVQNNENMYGYIYLHTCYMQFLKTHNLVSMVGSLQLSCSIWQLDFNCSVIWNVNDLLSFDYLYCTHMLDILDSLECRKHFIVFLGDSWVNVPPSVPSSTFLYEAWKSNKLKALFKWIVWRYIIKLWAMYFVLRWKFKFQFSDKYKLK